MVPLLDGESVEEARARLDLDAREAAWRAAGGGGSSGGCQVVVAGGLLPSAAEDGDGGGCVVGHLVSSGQVFNANEEAGECRFVWVYERFKLGW